MRRLIVSAFAIAALLIPAASANAVQRHVHSLHTPNGKSHPIASGVSLHAPCTAFLNFHNNVHLGVFAAGKNPNTITVQFIPGEFC
jgi:hypothetical protein